MDHAVAAAYGWENLDLGHGFHETKQGIRFTISEPARRDVLQRLLTLNHERNAEEVEQGRHDKTGKGRATTAKRVRAKNSTDQKEFFQGDDDDEPEPAESETTKTRTASRVTREQPSETDPRPTPIDEVDSTEIMAAFRQAARGRGWLERDELVKEVSVALGFQRLGAKADETLRNHLRAAIRRRIIEADGASLVRPGTTTMADYALDELRTILCSVMRKGTRYDREEVMQGVVHHLGFSRLIDNIRDSLKSALNSAIRQGVLCYEGNTVWRE